MYMCGDIGNSQDTCIHSSRPVGHSARDNRLNRLQKQAGSGNNYKLQSRQWNRNKLSASEGCCGLVSQYCRINAQAVAHTVSWQVEEAQLEASQAKHTSAKHEHPPDTHHSCTVLPHQMNSMFEQLTLSKR
jgi:hypothetical protein